MGGHVARHLEGHREVLRRGVAHLLGRHVDQRRVARAARGDHDMIHRISQAAEEVSERGRVVDVKGRGALGADLGPGLSQPLLVAAGEDRLGPLGAGRAGGLQSDAPTPPEHEHELSVEGPGHGVTFAGAPAARISWRTALTAAAKISEKLGKGWIVSRRMSIGTRARMASVACWSHSPASGPSA